VTADNRFQVLLAQVREGDERAAAELVRLYEPQIQRVVRLRLTDTRLRRQMDTVDVCQSVMGEFFLRVALGQFELNTPGELIALLARMTRNKVINRAKHHYAARRDISRQTPIADAASSLPARDATPSAIVSRRELLQACRRLLTDDEHRLAEARAEGRGWEELAEEFGASPGALRRRYARALDRIAESFAPESGDGV